MPDHMMTLEALLLVGALLVTSASIAWLALAMPVHWEQVRGTDRLSRRSTAALRVLGVIGLLASLTLCLVVDHGSMASLVWVMSVAASALLTALLLSWRPGLLRPLVAWLPRRTTR